MRSSSLSRNRTRNVAVAVWLGCAIVCSHAQAVTLTVAGWPDNAVAGTPVHFWLVALNPSQNAAAWNFRPEIGCRLVSVDGPVETAASLSDPTQETSVSIPPAGFARVEYVMPVPRSLTGEVTVAFGDLPVARAVLDVQPPPPEVAAIAPATPVWKRFLRDAEPKESGTDLEPGRFFKEHVFGYEPFYFIAGTESPNAKFQVSFKYRLLNEAGALAAKAPALTGWHLAYTQTSLWDWNAPSAPFFDSSYKPELLYGWERVLGGHATNWFRLDLQGGVQHESNGRGDAESRSLNIGYLQPTLVFGWDDYLQFTLIPRVWTYAGDLSDNPDLKDYRGYGDLRAVLGWKRGLQVSALGRLGDDGKHGSLQIDVTYPMMRVLKGSFSVYLHAQYFTGYGESLLDYRERSSMLRVGIALYR
jgi:outer membrane phospholipase A